MAVCVILAVICGAYLAGKISERTTTFIGALLFFFFAAETYFYI
jgi:putative Ca2+/H+ antiporter (TMEM165/GDT1 family)